MEQYRKDTDRFYVQAYYKVYAQLSPKAVQLERKTTFSVFGSIFESIQTVLIDLNKNVDKYFPNPVVNVDNIKISQAEILNFLHTVRVITTFYSFLYVGLAAELSRSWTKADSKLQPKFRKNFIEEKTQFVVSVINKDTNEKTLRDFINVINKMKQTGKDVLVKTDDGSNEQLFNTLGGVTSGVSRVTSNFNLNPFYLFGKLWLDFIHWIRLRQQKEKEWMEARTNLLRLEMEGIDPNSEEYKRLLSIVEKYDRMIQDYDEKLDQYFE